MADWFTGLVAEAGREVLALPDMRESLKGVDPDRDTANSITKKIAELRDSGELRELHGTRVAAVERLDRDREGMLRELLPRQWRALGEAEAKVSRLELQRGLYNAGSLGGVRRPFTFALWEGIQTVVGAVRRRLRLGRPLEARDPLVQLRNALASARAERARAREVFDAAAAAGDVAAQEPIRTIDGQRAEAVAALRVDLVAALTGRINEIIDHDLGDSFRREFSYSGSAWLVDQPGADAERLSAEINGAAFAEIRGKIDGGLTGAVGVSGPRGIGKTTLLNRFARSVPDLSPLAPWDSELEVRRWGVSVAAPAQYDARDFLLHLFGTLCAAVLGEARVRALEEEMTGARADSGGLGVLAAWLAAYLAVLAALCGALVLGLDTSRPVTSPHALADLLIAGCCAVAAVVTAAFPIGWVRSWVRLKARESADLAPEPRMPHEGTAAEYLDQEAEYLEWQFFSLVWFARAVVVAVSGAAACALFTLVAVGRPVNPGYLAAAGLTCAVVLALLLLRSLVRGLAGLSSVRLISARRALNMRRYRAQVRAAENWYRKVKFQQSYTTGWSGTVTLSPSALPVQAQAGRSGSRVVSQVSMSIPEIVAGFGSFTDILRRPQKPVGTEDWDFDAPAGTGGRGAGAPPDPQPVPVVIGIDEVDKIEDPRTAQAFFNQIKGLFGDASCLFLISISDDAMAAYERRGLPLRDAFDSSLSTVIALSLLTRQEARKLIGSRLVRVTEPSADVLYVLSGGLPRELVRLIRRAVDLQRDLAASAGADQEPSRTLPPVPLDDLAVTLIADQVAAQRRAVLIRGRALEPCAARDGLLAWASDPASDAAADGRVGASAAAEYFGQLVATGLRLMEACACVVGDPPDGSDGRTSHADGCAAQENGAYLFWLGTVGQVFGKCQETGDFMTAERPRDPLSFERLTRARQNFSLGPSYVHGAVTAVRDAWRLDPPPAEDAAAATSFRRVS
jgi:hypothetical protein